LAAVQDYYKAALESGDAVSLVVLQEAGHYELLIPPSFAWPEIRKAIEALIQ
jgi:hypothetical protein